MREWMKHLMYWLATIVAVPWLVSFAIRRAMFGPDRALEASTQSLASVPGLSGEYLRRAFLARTIADCHRTATVQFGTLFSKADARLGENVYIGPRCHLGLVHIEKDVLLAAGVHVPSGAKTHGTEDVTTPIRDQEGVRTVVRIGEGSWVGSAAVVMADVGKHCVVGAGAIVVQAIPDYSIAAGNPARVIRSRVPKQA